MLVFFNKNFDIKAIVKVLLILTVSICSFVILFGFIDNFWGIKKTIIKEKSFEKTSEKIPEISSEIAMKKFLSVEEFKVYLEERQTANNFSGGVNSMMTRQTVPAMMSEGLSLDSVVMSKNESAGYSAERVSETNVQVAGIDEPDIVKTDGKEIFLSSLMRLYASRAIPMPMLDSGSVTSKNINSMPYPYQEPTTQLISAFPVDKMNLDAEIKANGNLLLSNNILVVLGNNKIITGFDVSDSQNPKELWKVTLGDRESLTNARLKDGKIFLLVSEYADYTRPCPFYPLTVGETKLEIACTDIYYPTVNTEADAIYSLISLDVANGEVVNKNSFVGSYNNANFYMSSDYAYVAYMYNGDMVKFIYNFFIQNQDLIPDWVTQKMAKLIDYDLSDSTKMTELSIILSRWQNSMDRDETLEIENEMVNRGEEYYKAHLRELNYTGIVKFDLSDLSVVATGAVSGQPLNQFSFDEYNGHLRVATTVGQQGFWLAGGMLNSRNQTVSDVNILDKDLKRVGSVNNLGETERIYSVRFIGDKGYVVTFRQTDPFYVLDLKDENNPAVRGELKIPGYSSYLHPLKDNLILGIGKEDNYVKLSLFDVSDPANPKETEKYVLKEYWSEALNNHHAFLVDSKHEVFFIPGNQGGYVFSYTDGLKLKKAVNEDQLQRAIYLDDYMYLIGQEKIVVLDEKTWERAGEFAF